MSRKQYGWASNQNGGAHQRYHQAHVYDDDDDGASGWANGVQNHTWVVAEACKVKDALFLGNVMAVQDATFVVMNKIGYCIKCQTGFAVPQTLRRVGVTYAVMNLLGAFLDTALADTQKDALLDKFHDLLETAGEQGFGVLLYSFDDLAWCCFAVVAYWLRKYRWTVAHAVRVMTSRRPALQLSEEALAALEALAARLASRADGNGGKDLSEEEEKILTNTCSNAQRLGDVLGGKAGGAGHGAGSPTLRARPLTAGAAQNRIQWHGGGRLAAYSRPDAAASKPAVLPPSTARAVRPILRRPRNPAAESELTEGPARFAALALPAAESLFRPPAQVHGTWSATAHLKPDSAPAGLTAGMEGDAVGGGRQARAPGGAEPLALARRVKVPQPAAPTGARSSVSEWVGQVQLQELEGPGGAAGEAGAEMVPRAGAASTPPRPAKGAAARAAGRVEAGEAGEAARRPPLEPFPRGAARREGSGASLDERPRSPRSPRSEPPSPARRSESEPLPPPTLPRGGDASAGGARGSGSGSSSAYIAVKALNASMHEAGGADARLAASRGRRPAAAAPRGRPASAAVEESREAQGPREPRGDTRFVAEVRGADARSLATSRCPDERVTAEGISRRVFGRRLAPAPRRTSLLRTSDERRGAAGAQRARASGTMDDQQVVLETDSSTFVSFLGRSSSRAEDPPDAGLRGGARRAAESDQARDVVGGGAYGGAPRARLQFSRRLAQQQGPQQGVRPSSALLAGVRNGLGAYRALPSSLGATTPAVPASRAVHQDAGAYGARPHSAGSRALLTKGGSSAWMHPRASVDSRVGVGSRDGWR